MILTSSRLDLICSKTCRRVSHKHLSLLGRASIACEGIFRTDLTLHTVLQFPSLHLDASLGDL